MTRTILAGPILLSATLVAWTALVSGLSGFGTWHVYPALALAPVVIAYHVVLIVRGAPRRPMIVYALLHVALFVPLWLGCLMMISKDAL
jgi:hypothetical protein